jgi:tRNA G18 (ribose-2'-O)-methylase SpoU
LIGLDLAEDAVSLSEVSRSIDLGDRIALILGTEGKGLCRETLEYVDHSVRIPMMPGVDSLNVATASGIVLQFLFAKLHRPVGPSGVAS